MNKIILPEYITTQPSTGKKITFRPFTVKEEKSLLLALQENDVNIVVNAIKSVVKVCTDNKVDVEKIPYYDMEFIFLQIRAKSIGETIDLIGSCDCSETAKTEFYVDITEAYLEPTPTGEQMFKIIDTPYTIKFTHPSLSDFSKKLSDVDYSAEQVVTNCIRDIFTDDEVVTMTDEEKLGFIESMTSLQQRPIAEFLKNMPLTKIPAKYTCKVCKKEHAIPLSGFQNFFV